MDQNQQSNNESDMSSEVAKEANSESSPTQSNKFLSPLELAMDDNSGLDMKKAIQELKFYLMPIVIFIFFMVVIIMFVIRPISEMSDKLGTIRDKESEYNDMQNVLTSLEQLKQNQESDIGFISKIDQLVPTNSSRVVEYEARLRTIAEESNLESIKIAAADSLELSEAQLQPTGTGANTITLADTPLFIIQINVELEASGSLDDFQLFLNNLYNSTDFFIVSEMKINLDSENNLWYSEFVLTKYQFGGKSYVPDDLTDFVVGVPSPKVIEFIERRFNIKSNSNQNLTSE